MPTGNVGFEFRELEIPMKKRRSARKAPAPPPPGAIAATAEEAAAMLRISRAKFLKMVKEGEAPKGHKLGHNRRWRIDQLLSWAAHDFKIGALASATP